VTTPAPKRDSIKLISCQAQLNWPKPLADTTGDQQQRLGATPSQAHATHVAVPCDTSSLKETAPSSSAVKRNRTGGSHFETPLVNGHCTLPVQSRAPRGSHPTAANCSTKDLHTQVPYTVAKSKQHTPRTRQVQQAPPSCRAQKVLLPGPRML
jgi:hypothetical protein